MKKWNTPEMKELDFTNTLGHGRNHHISWNWFFGWFSCSPNPPQCTPTPIPTPTPPPSLS